MPGVQLFGRDIVLRITIPSTMATSTADIGLDAAVGSMPCIARRRAPSQFDTGSEIIMIKIEATRPGNIWDQRARYFGCVSTVFLVMVVPNGVSSLDKPRSLKHLLGPCGRRTSARLSIVVSLNKQCRTGIECIAEKSGDTSAFH